MATTEEIRIEVEKVVGAGFDGGNRAAFVTLIVETVEAVTKKERAQREDMAITLRTVKTMLQPWVQLVGMIDECLKAEDKGSGM